MGAVGTKDFVYLSHWAANTPLMSPLDYSIFVLWKQGIANGVVLVYHDFLVRISPLLVASRSPYRVNETGIIGERLALFRKEAKGDFPGKEILLRDLATIIVSLLAEQVATSKVVNLGSGKTGCIGSAIEYINKNYHKKIVLEDLATRVHYSQYHFIRLFQKETGKTPFAYLTGIRIAKAKFLLSGTAKTITDICYKCGFQNSSHFANFFKSNTGMSPSEYRRSTTETIVKD